MSAVTVQHRVFPDVLAPAIMFQCQCVASHLPVSILTRPVGRVQPVRITATELRTILVSILTRPVGRVQPVAAGVFWRCHSGFNPHPARGPSATRRFCRGRCAGCPGFNPHPARGPSATTPITQVRMGTPMFQSSPGPWAECNPVTPTSPSAPPSPVSILTRPVGRVQLSASVPVRSTAIAQFQSSPGPWAECNVAAAVLLSKPVGFQSSPGPWAECNAPPVEMSIALPLFQSSPGPWAECNCRSGQSPIECQRFNPHPARGPSATRVRRNRRLGAIVSILTRPVGRVQHFASCVPASTLVFQSSPGPWAECNDTPCKASDASNTGFNPHPARGPSATKVSVGNDVAAEHVSILTRPVGRVQQWGGQVGVQ